MRAPFASDPAASRGRLVPEEESSFRSCFQRDRDRIIHASAFRRLKHKTQVFVEHEGDYYRTRLTHSIEVAQVARTIAGALGLNGELTEAVALAHDLGHTPFGHTGEDALHAQMADRFCRRRTAIDVKQVAILAIRAEMGFQNALILFRLTLFGRQNHGARAIPEEDARGAVGPVENA